MSNPTQRPIHVVEARTDNTEPEAAPTPLLGVVMPLPAETAEEDEEETALEVFESEGGSSQ